MGCSASFARQINPESVYVVQRVNGHLEKCPKSHGYNDIVVKKEGFVASVFGSKKNSPSVARVRVESIDETPEVSFTFRKTVSMSMSRDCVPKHELGVTVEHLEAALAELPENTENTFNDWNGSWKLPETPGTDAAASSIRLQHEPMPSEKAREYVHIDPCVTISCFWIQPDSWYTAPRPYLRVKIEPRFFAEKNHKHKE